jgi:hypothetical protein
MRRTAKLFNKKTGEAKEKNVKSDKLPKRGFN